MPSKAVRLSYTGAFHRQLKHLARKYRHLGADLQPLLDQLAAGETPGDRVQAVQTIVYKVRVPNRDARRGKSGGYRVIYVLESADLRLLLAIYSKTEQSDISADQLQRILEEELQR